MPEKVVVPRERHPISRRDIDPDALRVLYRLQQHNHIAYLVGGSVRDLILGRRPKDFDIGTDAHPGEIKKLFRNCWIIGRRFRLAHIKFGQKTIEVATFRKNVADLPADPPDTSADEPVVVATLAPGGVTIALPDDVADTALPPVEFTRTTPDGRVIVVGPDETPEEAADDSTEARSETGRGRRAKADARADIVHRDNTFGTTEEDAFRRDFTVNALFYDVATKSVIDYVGGLEDLERRVIRSIGDPKVRFVEDPVRMLRAAVLSARLDFSLDPLVIEAINELGHLITKASPARLLEEYFKILRSGHAEASFRALDRVGLLAFMTPELASPSDALWDSLARLDRYRRQHQAPPADLTTAILIGALLHPIGALNRRAPDRGQGQDVDEIPERVSFGALPVARKDLDRLRHLLQTVPRLLDPALPPRVARGLPHRPSFGDAVTWLEVFGDDADKIEEWKQLRAAHPPRHAHGRDRGHGAGHRHAHGPRHPGAVPGAPQPPDPRVLEGGADGRPRRRRRRRRRRGGGGTTTTS